MPQLFVSQAMMACYLTYLAKTWFESTLICQGLQLLKLTLEQGMPHIKLVQSRRKHLKHIVETLLATYAKSSSLGLSLQGTDFKLHLLQMRHHFAMVRSLFLSKMRSREIGAIEDLVKLNCSFEEGFGKH